MFKPFYQNCVIRINKPSLRLDSGLYMPETSKNVEKIRDGWIVAIGEGKILENGTRRLPEAKVGDRVLVNIYAGDKQKIGESEYLFCKEDDLWCVVESDAPLSTFFPQDRD